MTELKLLTAVLDLFDEGGGAAAPAGETAGASGETPSVAGKKPKGEYDNVIFGKQPDAGAEEAESATGDADQPAQRVPFRDLINGEYKDDFQKEFDEIFKQRHKDYKDLQKRAKDQGAIVDVLMQKYGIKDGNLESLSKAIEDDDAMWTDAAYEAGMSTEQYKQFHKLERENNRLIAEQQEAMRAAQAERQVQQWQAEAAALKQQFPDFDLEQELVNETFTNLIRPINTGGHGLDMETAYKMVHFNDLMKDTAYNVATATEKKVTDNIRAKGSRPIENGTTSQSAFTIKADPSKWTKKDRAEVARRAAMGDKIYL